LGQAVSGDASRAAIPTPPAISVPEGVGRLTERARAWRLESDPRGMRPFLERVADSLVTRTLALYPRVPLDPATLRRRER
jgi:hypothetical protein